MNKNGTIEDNGINDILLLIIEMDLEYKKDIRFMTNKQMIIQDTKVNWLDISKVLIISY